MKRLSYATFLLMLLFNGLTACRQPEGTELPFETIDRSQIPGTEIWQSEMEEPGLLILTSAEDVAQKGHFFTQDARLQLQNLDFDVYFAIGVFQGRLPSVPAGQPYAIEVRKITVRDGTVTIYTHVPKPARGENVWLPVFAAPYHLVRVQRKEDIQGEIRFVLNIDGKTIIRQAHDFP
jgi:hypothetical protein